MVTLLSPDDWKERLCSLVGRGRDKVVLVVGAGLSWDGHSGVWGVSDIVGHIEKNYPIKSSVKPAAAAYQDVMVRLKGTVDSDEVERTIRLAVLAAAKDGSKKAAARKELEGDAGNLRACKELQADSGEWHLPKGALALAELIGFLATKINGQPNGKHPCVLTTNFDGLLELALICHMQESTQRSCLFQRDLHVHEAQQIAAAYAVLAVDPRRGKAAVRGDGHAP